MFKQSSGVKRREIVDARHCEATGARAHDDRLREANPFRRLPKHGCFRLRSSSFGGHVVALLLVMTVMQLEIELRITTQAIGLVCSAPEVWLFDEGNG